ncbi:MAG: GNAT family N-acetyltransferase [Alphaproteobacteria bacterium]|nr:GNAT family N-acetyltransferase [Alphaproteobacteria bacterium]
MIRRATADDVDALEAMDRVCFPGDHPYGLWTWDRGVCWIAHHAGEAIGYSAAHPMKRGIWFFSRVGVMPAARGWGLQRKFLATLERHGRREGWREIVTYTVPLNGWSTRNILAAGYRTYEPKKSYVGYQVIHMRKKLA